MCVHVYVGCIKQRIFGTEETWKLEAEDGGQKEPGKEA
jgi:hypothetical protein